VYWNARDWAFTKAHGAHVLSVYQSVVSRMWNRFHATENVSHGQRSETFNDSSPGPIYRSTGQELTVL